jgi:hypothetical protein
MFDTNVRESRDLSTFSNIMITIQCAVAGTIQTAAASLPAADWTVCIYSLIDLAVRI